MNVFKQRMKEGKPLVGTLLTMGVPIVAEMISRCRDLTGYGWIFQSIHR